MTTTRSLTLEMCFVTHREASDFAGRELHFLTRGYSANSALGPEMNCFNDGDFPPPLGSLLIGTRKADNVS